MEDATTEMKEKVNQLVRVISAAERLRAVGRPLAMLHGCLADVRGAADQVAPGVIDAHLAMIESDLKGVAETVTACFEVIGKAAEAVGAGAVDLGPPPEMQT